MPTIQFTYNKKESVYCYGFWTESGFVVRGKSRDKESVWGRFLEDLKRLEQE